MVPGAQGDRWQRKGRRVSKDCGGGARRPRCRMAQLHGPTGGARDTAPQIPVHLKREISEKKWAEARQLTGGRTSKKNPGC